MPSLKLYMDESGSITRNKLPKLRYFIIGSIETKTPKKVAKEFRKAKVDYLKNNPVQGLAVTDEIKGSEMPADFREFIFQRLVSKTDIVFDTIIVDNHNITERLKQDPHIAFNYLIKLYLSHKIDTPVDLLDITIDNRNKKLPNLKDLEHYLTTELYVREKANKVIVDYTESHNNDLVQVADVFSNFVYKMMRCQSYGDEFEEHHLTSYKILQQQLKCIFKFPLSDCVVKFEELHQQT